MEKKIVVRTEEKEVVLSNLEKVFWPEEGYTKAHLLHYYAAVSPYLLPHLAGRPMVMSRYPEGIKGHSFYQKECPAYAPAWLPTVALPSAGRRKVINYLLVEDLAGLLWLVNQGAIEMHPWLSLASRPDYPTAAVLDLDPAPPAGFAEARQLALRLRDLLAALGLKAYPKTSGATGLHLYLPLAGRYSYAAVRQALAVVARLAVKAWPDLGTAERAVERRTGRVYLDVAQNARGKTIASVYSVRPLPGAPVSFPLTWEELAETAADPRRYHLASVPRLLAGRPDPFAPVLTEAQSLDHLLQERPHRAAYP